MTVGRKHINMDFCLKNAINKSMLLCDFTAPSTIRFPLQRFRVAQSCLGMIVKFAYEPKCFFVSLRHSTVLMSYLLIIMISAANI